MITMRAAGHVSDDAAGWTPLVVPERGVGYFDKWNDCVEAGQEFKVRLGSVDRLVTDADSEVGLQKAPDYIVRRDRRTVWTHHAFEEHATDSVCWKVGVRRSGIMSAGLVANDPSKMWLEGRDELRLPAVSFGFR